MNEADIEQVKGIFSDMLNTMKSELKSELKQEFTAQFPDPDEQQEENTVPVEYFSAEQVDKLGESIARQLSGSLSQLSNEFNELKTAIENTPNQYAGRPEATGGSFAGQGYV